MNKTISIVALCLIILAVNFVTACTKEEKPANQVSYPIADGTFIQDNLVANWDDAQWQKELGSLKDAGMHYLVFAPTLHTNNEINQTIYPSSLPDVKVRYQVDLVENCLRNAQKAGFKVFLGLNFNEKWWTASFTPEWFFGQMELGNKVAEELVNRYKSRYGETMYGWYWVWEVDNLNWKSREKQDMLIQALNTNLDHLNTITPEMPFMLCPFVNHRMGTSTDNEKLWTYVFSQTHLRKGDIFAPQDCIGAGGLTLDLLDEWFGKMYKAVKTKPGLKFWSDAETFDQRFWTSAPIDRFIKQMQIADPYVENFLTFAYSHYYSPTQAQESFHSSYLYYLAHGEVPPEVPQAVNRPEIGINPEGKLVFYWQEPENKNTLAGYYLYRNGTLFCNIQYNNNGQCKSEVLTDGKLIGQCYCQNGECMLTFEKSAVNPDDNFQYAICSYSGSGKVSELQDLKDKRAQ